MAGNRSLVATGRRSAIMTIGLFILFLCSFVEAVPNGAMYQGRLHPRDIAASVSGWSLFAKGSLDTLGLESNCEEALYQVLQCVDSATILVHQSDTSGNPTTTTSTCTTSCSSSLESLHKAVASSCAQTPNLTPGVPFIGMVDKLWDNWNQTCFTDPKTGKNCNEAIAAFPDVEEMDDLSDMDVCSYCYVESLALMQASKYSSSYDTEFFKSQYKYVAERCHLDVTDFDATPSVFNVIYDKPKPTCATGDVYVTKAGDTCDSVALAHKASSATLFYTNPNILDCSAIREGISLCLPAPCDTQVIVKDEDTCVDIAIDAGISTLDLVIFNSQLDRNCSNLHSTNPSWGSTLCVSTPGGTYSPSKPTSDGPINGNKGGSQGQITEVATPPSGAAVAPKTTLECGAWYVHSGELLQCSQICLSNYISINVLTAANPSLGVATCDADLVWGDAYCVAPLSGGSSDLPTPTNPSTSTLAPVIPNPSGFPVIPIPSISTLAPVMPNPSGFPVVPMPTPSAPGQIQDGVIWSCRKWHKVSEGDNCWNISQKYGVQLSDFYYWNPAVGDKCQSLWRDYYVCVGL
ncbi:carbohydrate-binding module family 50 protein [Apiospora kogelbergensis]|uniref:Carbohydrate-binding module family 50 protein n=1 Tax=Apiospora kogelbergensis TaxID=1337665 RepID=A0AAW0QY92_9PEZI